MLIFSNSPDSMNMKFAGLCIPNKNQLCSVNKPHEIIVFLPSYSIMASWHKIISIWRELCVPYWVVVSFISHQASKRLKAPESNSSILWRGEQIVPEESRWICLIYRIIWLPVQIFSHSHISANDLDLGISQCVHTYMWRCADSAEDWTSGLAHDRQEFYHWAPSPVCVVWGMHGHVQVSSLSNLPDEPRACQFSPEIPSPAPEYWDYRRAAMPVQHLCGCWGAKIWSSHLHDKHFTTHWAISSPPLYLYLESKAKIIKLMLKWNTVILYSEHQLYKANY